MPPDWNKTRRQLEAEIAAGAGHDWNAFAWAREYERSLLPSDFGFPREGDVYQVVEDFEIRYTTQWDAPYTDGGRATLRAGDLLCAMASDEDRPVTIFFRTDKPLEARIVPEDVRKSPLYDSFYVSIETLDLNVRCKRIIYS